MTRDDIVNRILASLINYFEEKDLKESIYIEHPKVIHYYLEIIRFKSKLNFIINKTLRSLHKDKSLDFSKKSRYFYATYRIIWESASIDSLIKELEIQEEQNFLSFIRKLESFSWKRALEGKSEVEKLSIEEAIPSFFINHLLPVMSYKSLKENIKIMNNFNNNLDCTIRINFLINIKDQNENFNDIKQEFKKMGIYFRKDQDIPELIHVPIKKKNVIIKTKSYKNGQFIFQDKASAGVVKVLDPQPGEFICDMCAAPGIKTSLIAQYSNNNSRIIAGEFLKYRASESKKMLEHLNISRSHVINTDSIKFPLRLHKKFDKILLDAPCTGSGTFLSNPELKWRQNEKFLHQNIILQKKLLESALGLLKSNGILVYSTCSLYPEEGELQIQEICNRLEPLKLSPWISNSYKINGSFLPGTGRLFPSTHGTQGFFIGKFNKKI